MDNLIRYAFLFTVIIFFQSSAQDLDAIKFKFAGVTTRKFLDSSRSSWLGNNFRPLSAVIWYPADKGGERISVAEGSMKITLIKEGEVSEKLKKYPLIILSPGSGQKADDMFWMGYYLSLRGYITLSVNHSGTAAEERQNGPISLTDFCIWERPQDLSAALNYILKDTTFSKRIDTSKIGAAGFSLGGTTVLWTTGARLNRDSLQANSPPPPPQLINQIDKYIELTKTDSVVKKSVQKAENSFKDYRIKAVFALAPAVGYGFTKEGLEKVNVPVEIVVGDKDLIAPPENNAKRFSRYIEGAKLIILPGEVGHYIHKLSEEARWNQLEDVSKLALDFFKDKLLYKK